MNTVHKITTTFFSINYSNT